VGSCAGPNLEHYQDDALPPAKTRGHIREWFDETGIVGRYLDPDEEKIMGGPVWQAAALGSAWRGRGTSKGLAILAWGPAAQRLPRRMRTRSTQFTVTNAPRLLEPRLQRVPGSSKAFGRGRQIEAAREWFLRRPCLTAAVSSSTTAMGHLASLDWSLREGRWPRSQGQ